MWRDLEDEAILIGLDLHYFWTLTPKQWIKYVRVYNEKQKNEVRLKDQLNFMLGQYIGYAVNDPKHYPKKPFMETDTDLKPMTDEEMELQARRNTIKMGGVIYDS